MPVATATWKLGKPRKVSGQALQLYARGAWAAAGMPAAKRCRHFPGGSVKGGLDTSENGRQREKNPPMR